MHIPQAIKRKLDAARTDELNLIDDLCSPRYGASEAERRYWLANLEAKIKRLRTRLMKQRSAA